MRRILVTGGAGFLGSHLCERLALDRAHVICLDNFHTGSAKNAAHLQARGVEVVHHDVVDPYEIEVDEIYHLACPASPVHYQRDPVRTLETAFLGTRNALALARACGARVLITSTSEVYGDPLTHPQPETYWGNVNPVGKRACYDEGKRSGEALATAFAERDQVDVRIARIFNTYGPGMSEHDGRVVSNFVVQALRGRALTLYGDGSQTRSFCFVSDLIDGLMRLMAQREDPGPVNLGNPDELSIRELARVVIDVTASGSALEYRPMPADDPVRRRPDITRARRVLGWHPTVGIREGVRRVAESFRHTWKGATDACRSSSSGLVSSDSRIR